MEKREAVFQRLRKTGFKLTPQRIAVIEFLEGNENHPSADVVFQKVKERYPMISFSTVYNTLKVLCEIDEIHLLTIMGNKVNFDPNTNPHHHLLCEECLRIRDVYFDMSRDLENTEGNLIKKNRVYFYGICSQCLKQKRKV